MTRHPLAILVVAALAAILLTSCGDTSEEATVGGDTSAVCGDGVCYLSEKRDGSCADDCAPGVPVCGNGSCSDGETHDTCPDDCAASTHSCGDGVCFIDELDGACAEDCPADAPVCGNGSCADGEAFATCPEDCEDTGGPVSNAPTTCDYPAAPMTITAGAVMPPLSWNSAFRGSDGVEVGFDLTDFHCDEAEWGMFTSVLFVVGTGWCPACPDYIQYVGEIAGTLQGSGMLVVFVEAEDANSVASTSEGAQEFINGLIGNAPSLRVGDGETNPAARTIYNSPIITGFPSAFVVRRSDMQIIADQGSSQYILPFPEIAADPDATEWEPGAGGGGGGFQANCGAEDEESYEPNDTPATAGVISPGSFEGGVCAPAADFYRVELSGAWRLDLQFSNALGDLDVHIWDEENNEVDRRSGSYTTTDNESFEHNGPATIMIYGYGLATAPYTLTLTEL